MEGFKKQWWGVEGSPAIATLTFDMPVSDAVNVGARIVNSTEGPWNDLNAQFGASYQIPLGYYGDHTLRFGMALGVRYTNFNFTELDDLTDPALLGVSTNNIVPDGSFGLAYQYKGLSVGVAMPHFTEPGTVSGDIVVRPWYHMIASAGYRFDLGYSQDWSITPTVLYHREQELSDQFEGILKAAYQDTYWIGGSYRQDIGVTAFAGAEINDLFSLNYFYSFGNITSPVSQQSHEVTLRFRIGGKRRNADAEESDDTDDIEDDVTSSYLNSKTELPDKDIPQLTEQENTKEEDPDADNPIFNVDESITLDTYDKSYEVHYSFDPNMIIGRTPGGTVFDLDKGNYISVGKFKYSRDAEPAIKEMQGRGLNPKLVYIRSERVYYVYVLEKDDLEWSRKIIVSLRKLRGFDNSHLLILE